MATLPINYGVVLAGPVTLGDIFTYAPTHASHMGLGGFIELPTIEHRNSIPIGDNLNEDGISSGRRKLGMIVYVIDQKKYYQLRPTTNGITEVNFTMWETASYIDKLCWLHPTATVYNTDGDPFTGTNNPDDCWTEIEVLSPNKAVISKNSSINNIVTLTQSEYDVLDGQGLLDSKTLYVIS